MANKREISIFSPMKQGNPSLSARPSGVVDSPDSHQVYFVVSYQDLDYTFVAIKKDDIDNLDCFVNNQITPVTLVQETNLTKGVVICIVQHPGGKPKQLSQDRILSVDRPYIKYEADTEPGSSGSPVFTSKEGMKAIAIHSSGREGAFNKGTLSSEILSHLQRGTCTLTFFISLISRFVSEWHISPGVGGGTPI